MLASILSNTSLLENGANMPAIAILLIAAIILGIFNSLIYSFSTSITTKSFIMSLITLPAIVVMVISMVNGNIGAGVAVAGTFSLVRFRSIPGTAKEISAIFLAMATGLVLGMGYIGYAVLFVVIMTVVTLAFSVIKFKEDKETERRINITVPEDLDYISLFDDVMKKYTNNYRLLSAKTVNMGSLFKLKYKIELKDPTLEKEFVDELRIRNGNLEIMIAPLLGDGQDAL